jgi:hypothetical protein
MTVRSSQWHQGVAVYDGHIDARAMIYDENLLAWVPWDGSLSTGAVTIGKVDQGSGGASAWKVDGSAVTQPVSGPVTNAQLRAAPVEIALGDTASVDAFGRARVSSPEFVFDAQFTYDLQPLLYESLTAGSGATITHDATNRCALFTFASSPNTSQTYLQTYEHFRYQPGRSQQIFATFCFGSHVANVRKFVGYSDGTNGIEFQSNGAGFQWVIYSTTTAGNQTKAQADWNLDTLNGAGPSGLTLDVADTQIAIIDLQALYVGRVRVGFVIDGAVVYVHEFDHANHIAYPYIATANLPIAAGMYSTGTVSATMRFVCASVISEGGNGDLVGYGFTVDSGNITAANGARTHGLSLRHNTTFNGIANRSKFVLDSIDVLVTGNNPVYYEVCVGDVITGTTTFTDVNATYSGMEYNVAGTTSGAPALVLASGYVPASNQVKAAGITRTTLRVPISLGYAGAVRANGTLTVLVTGLGGTSTCRVAANWHEVR